MQRWRKLQQTLWMSRWLDALSERALVAGIAVVLLLANLLPIWLVRFPPLQDYPNHLLTAHIIAHYGDPNFDYAQNFILSWRPVPNMLADVIMAGLAHVVSTLLAGKLVLSLYIVFFPVSIFYLLNTISSDKLLLGFFSFPLTYNWFFNMGFLNFCLGLPLYFFAVGFWWKTRSGLRNRVGRIVVLGLLTSLIYLSHFVTFGVWLMTAVSLSLATVGWRATAKRVCLLTGSAVGLLIPATFIFDPVRKQLGAILDLCTPAVIAFASLPTKFATAYQPFISFRTLVEGAILLVLLSIYLVLLFRNAARWNANPFLGLALLMVGLFLVLPVGFRGPFYIAPRILILAVILGLPVLYVPVKARWRFALLGFLTIMSVLYMVIMLGVYRRANAELTDYYTGLQHIPSGQTVLPILRVRRSYVYYHEHAWAYYHIDNGGLSPGIFAGRDQLLTYQHRPPLPYNDDVVFAGAMARRNLYVFLSQRASRFMRTALLSRGFAPWISLGDNVIYKVAYHSRYKDDLDVSLIVKNYPYVIIYGPEDADVDPYLLEYYRIVFSQGQMRVLERVVSASIKSLSEKSSG